MKIPFNTIGESNWVSKFKKFLDDIDVEIEPANDVEIARTEDRLDCELPQSIAEYFKAIGVYDEMEFMPLMYPLDSFLNITESEWKKIIKSFDSDDLENYIVFAESIDGGPVCFEKNSGNIYLFTSTPPMKGMIFTDFNDYVINEVINVLIENKNLSEEEELELKEEYFQTNSDIDEEMRLQFLFGGYDNIDTIEDDDDFDDDYDEDDDYFDDYDE